MAVDVVLVDDAEEVHAVLRAALRLDGRFRVVGEASTGARAVALAESLQPDVVLLDIGLPDLSGQDVLSRIQAVAPAVKVVIVTGRSADEAEWFADHSSAFLSKEHLGEIVEILSSLFPGAGDSVPASSSTLTLPRALTSPGRAREHTRRRLHEWNLSHLEEAALLVVSELTSNAVAYAETGFELRLSPSPGPDTSLRIEVLDAGPGWPEPGDGDQAAESGRGLILVSALSRAWGASRADGGKIVWSELAAGPDAERRRPEPGAGPATGG